MLGIKRMRLRKERGYCIISIWNIQTYLDFNNDSFTFPTCNSVLSVNDMQLSFLPLMIKSPCSSCVFKCKRRSSRDIMQTEKSPDLFIALKIFFTKFSFDYFVINVSLQGLQIWLFFSLLKILVSILLSQLLMKFQTIINQLSFIEL